MKVIWVKIIVVKVILNTSVYQFIIIILIYYKYFLRISDDKLLNFYNAMKITIKYKIVEKVCNNDYNNMLSIMKLNFYFYFKIIIINFINKVNLI